MSSILVPTDFSPLSQRAVELACKFASALSARLRLLHVVDVAYETVAGADQALETQQAEIEESGIPCDTALAILRPNTRILEQARDREVRMLVMGTHGRGGARRLLLGSFTETALRDVDIPVVSLNPDARIPEQVDTIVAGLDRSGAARSALNQALRLGSELGTRCIAVVHAEENDGEVVFHAPDHEWKLSTPRGDLTVDLRAASGAATEVLLRAAEEQSADLLAVGAHGREGLTDLLFGSVAEHLVRHAPCPVMTMRNPA